METSSELRPVGNKQRIALILKFALVAAVFWFLNYKGLLTADTFRKLFHYPVAIAICLFLMALNTVLGALRWQVLLHIQGAHLKFMRVLQLNMVGAFFNIALPGAVSGDLIKAVYVAKQFKDRRAAVFGSMIFDRLLGVAALVFVASFSAVVSSYVPWGGALPPALLYSIEFFGLALIGFFIYLFCSHQKDPLFKILQFFTKRHTKLVAIDRLYHGVMSYRTHPVRILKAIALSILIHSLLVLIFLTLTEAISPQPIPLVALAVVAPIGMLATTIPVLPAGVGTGHAAFYALFKLIGSDLGAEVFSLFVIFQVVVGLIGGLVYLKVSHESPTEVPR